MSKKKLATYFTALGWQNYSTALLASKLLDNVKANNYYVSAVALLPPKITALDASHWKSEIPVLVLYENPAYQQKQTLKISLTFTQTDGNSGVRGLAINSMQAESSSDPCKCQSMQEPDK